MHRLISAISVFFTICLSMQCGVYSFRATNLPPEIKSVYIPIFESDLAADEMVIDIKEELTTAVRDRFVAATRLTLADQEKADAYFIGRLKRYTREIAEYDENENPTRYKITLNVDAEFRNIAVEGVIWQQNEFSVFEFFEVDQDAEDLGEREAASRLLEKFARDLVTRATENW